MSTPRDYFSKEAREARRQARFERLEGQVVTADKKKKVTTQNAGLQAVALVRSVLDNFTLPSQAKLGYTGIRGMKVASNARDVDDGVVTIHAEFRTRMGVNVNVDFPVEIHNGQLLEPSIFIHDGAPRVLAQSAFDALTSRNTLKEEAPIRAMYSPPDDKAMDLMQRKNRYQMDRVNTGMFSVRRKSAKDALKAALRGTAIEAGWDKEADPGQPDMLTNPGVTPTGVTPGQTPVTLEAPGAGQEWKPGQTLTPGAPLPGGDPMQVQMGPTSAPGMDNPDNQYKGPVTTAPPMLKKLPNYGPGYGTTPVDNADPTKNERTPQTHTQHDFSTLPEENTQPEVTQQIPMGPALENTQPAMPWYLQRPASKLASPEDYDAEDKAEKPDHDRNDMGKDDWLDPAEVLGDNDIHVGESVSLAQAMEVKERGGIAHDKSKGTKCEILRDHAGDNKSFVVRFEDGLECIVERAHLRTAGKKPKPLFKQKKQPKMCPKCNKAPCICHKKKESQMAANQDFVAKVNDELNLMRDAGLSDVDLRLAVKSKYGDDVYTAVFEAQPQ